MENLLAPSSRRKIGRGGMFLAPDISPMVRGLWYDGLPPRRSGAIGLDRVGYSLGMYRSPTGYRVEPVGGRSHHLCLVR